MSAAAFWSGRKVFVTGHTGFKGGWLSLWLSALGARVSGYALSPETSPSLFGLAGLEERMDSTLGDVRDRETLHAAMSFAAPEVVFHFAAQSLVRASYRDPAGTFATNVVGTANCLEAARACPGIAAVVVATSDKCYQNTGEGRPFSEEDRLGGRDPYSASKAAAELVVAAYRASFADAPRLASVRAGNVIGGGDWAAERLVPDAIRAFSQGRPLKLRNPGFTRPWQHVLEPLSGYLSLAQRLCEAPEYAEAWNFGPAEEDARPVAWLATQLAARWGKGAGWETDGASTQAEAERLSLACAKAGRRLEWAPRMRLEMALDWVVEWYSGQAGGADAAALTLEQIARYERLPSP